MSTRELRLQTIQGSPEAVKFTRDLMMRKIMEDGLIVQHETGLRLGKIIQVTLAPFNPQGANLGEAGEQVLETNGAAIMLTVELDDDSHQVDFQEGYTPIARILPDTVGTDDPIVCWEQRIDLEGLNFRHG